MDDAGISAIAVLDEIGISEIRLRDTLLRATNATELFSNTQNTANAAWKSNTELSYVAEQRYATTASKLTNLKNSALLFAQTIGDDLNPTVQKLIEGAGEIIDKLMALDSTQRMQIIRWAAIAAAIGPVILITGKVTKSIGTVSKGLGTFATAVGKAGGGFKGFMSVLTKSPAFWFAVAAATIAATAAIIDYASGAKQAREALEGMKKTAEDWKNTAADTFYGRSNGGLSFFGMSTDDFKKESAHSIQAASDWYTGLIAVWTDGKRETNAIVREWTDSWMQLTAGTREGLAGLKENADANGYTGLSAQIQSDMDTLDAMDREIAALLKKRQSKYFTEEDQRRLQELIAARGDIEIKYHLVEADAGGFDTIRDKMAAEVARAQARGQADADVTVYQNAIAAAGQGMAAVNAQIDAQYDKLHAGLDRRGTQRCDGRRHIHGQGLAHAGHGLPGPGASVAEVRQAFPGLRPRGACRLKLLIRLNQLGAKLCQCSPCIIQAGLGINDRIGCLTNLLRVVGLTGRFKLLSGHCQRGFILRDGLFLQGDLLLQKGHLRRQAFHAGVHILDPGGGQLEPALRLLHLFADGGERGLCGIHRGPSGIPFGLRQRQLLIGLGNGCLCGAHGGVGLIQLNIGCGHRIRRVLGGLFEGFVLAFQLFDLIRGLPVLILQRIQILFGSDGGRVGFSQRVFIAVVCSLGTLYLFRQICLLLPGFLQTLGIVILPVVAFLQLVPGGGQCLFVLTNRICLQGKGAFQRGELCAQALGGLLKVPNTCGGQLKLGLRLLDLPLDGADVAGEVIGVQGQGYDKVPERFSHQLASFLLRNVR